MAGSGVSWGSYNIIPNTVCLNYSFAVLLQWFWGEGDNAWLYFKEFLKIIGLEIMQWGPTYYS